MIKPEAPTKVKARPLGREFLIFWFGQSTSIMGTAFTQFGLPLLVFRLTGSAFNLALAQISIYLPYVLFGLFIGAWTDRMDRKKLLIWVNFLRGLVIISIPILAWLQGLNVAWIYIISFLNSILAVFSSAATSAVVPSLVEKDQLVAANGRISVTDSISRVAGPVLAGFLVLLAPLEMVFLIDSLSFFVAAGTLLLIESSFNPASSASREKSAKKNVLKEIKEGLVFLRNQSLVLNTTLLATGANLLGITAATQQIILVKHNFNATDQQVSFMFAAGGIGAVIFSFLVSRLPKRWSFGRIALGSQLLSGLFILLLGVAPIFELAPLLVILIAGCGIIFNVQFKSLVQYSVPNQLLGRVSSTITMLAFLAIPVGSLAGGSAIEWTGNVGLVYQIIGGLFILMSVAFIFTPLGQSQNLNLTTPEGPVKPQTN